MKTSFYLVTFFVFSSLLSAQKMSDGPYRVELSDTSNKNWDHKTDYQTMHFKQYTGNYTLYKQSEKIAAGHFVMQTIDQGDPSLSFDTGMFSLGQNLDFNPANKTFTYDGKSYKLKKAESTEDRVLSGILIVAKVRKFELD